MKLELKHLAPYLPYGLKLYRAELNKIYDLVVYNPSLTFAEGYIISEVTLEGNGVKPILRPLSDLTELGVDFATEHSINLLIGKDGNYGNTTLSVYKGKLTIEIENEEDYPKTERVDFITIQTIYDELLKNHYDIFGLIEKGLAVDINSLTKSAV